MAASRGRQAAAAGNPGADFSPILQNPAPDAPPTENGALANFAPDGCFNDQSLAKSKYRQQWSAGCGDSASSLVYDPSQYYLVDYSTTQGQTTQLNLQLAASYALNYHAGSHFSTFELGFQVRNAHKGQFAFSPTYNSDFDPSYSTDPSPSPVQASSFVTTLHNNNYYDNSYKIRPFVDFNQIVAYGKANPAVFTVDEGATHLNSDASNFNLQERITAGYLMNTIEINRFRLQTGLRFEGTNLDTRGYQVTINPDGSYGGTATVKGSGSYVDVLPSVQLRYAWTSDIALRAVYGRGISRPNPQDIIPSVTLDQTTNPYSYSLGNPNLIAEHANNFDLLYEQYLNPLGLIQAGFFYKRLSDPIVSLRSQPTSGPYAGFLVQQPSNAGSAYVTGIELAYQQHLSFLPGLLGGLGFSGNYSYIASEAKHVDPLRTDSPALLRQAPNTWNVSPTYDWKRFSFRAGLSYNGANIYQYQYENLDDDGSPNPQVGGTKGPAGDNYLYAHLQIDAQGSYRLPKGFTAYVSGLNLNNEVFGFYNGSTQYVVQREYYKPTYSFGVRWDLHGEK